jgi:hypothetical protein
LEKAKYGGGVKPLNGSQPSDYFNICSTNKDIKKQYKKPSHIHYHSKSPHHERHELQHKHGQHSYILSTIFKSNKLMTYLFSYSTKTIGDMHYQLVLSLLYVPVNISVLIVRVMVVSNHILNS